jgi:hypothetical protein
MGVFVDELVVVVVVDRGLVDSSCGNFTIATNKYVNYPHGNPHCSVQP